MVPDNKFVCKKVCIRLQSLSYTDLADANIPTQAVIGQYETISWPLLPNLAPTFADVAQHDCRWHAGVGNCKDVGSSATVPADQAANFFPRRPLTTRNRIPHQRQGIGFSSQNQNTKDPRLRFEMDALRIFQRWALAGIGGALRICRCRALEGIGNASPCTMADGYIQRHTSQSTTVEGIRRSFLDTSGMDQSNYSSYVAISRHGDGRPQLIRMQAFNQLSELLSDRLAFVQPYQDTRYVTTLINNGSNLTCHTFQRKYSRRYAPMSATAAMARDSGLADVILGSDTDAAARRQELEQQMGAVDANLKMKLRKLVSHIVKYVQQAHNLTIGGIVCEFVRDAGDKQAYNLTFGGIVCEFVQHAGDKFVQQDHKLPIGGIVCEFVRDAGDKIYLLSVLRVEWASNAGGHGSGSLASTILQSEPIEMADALVRGSLDDEDDVVLPMETAQQPEAPGGDTVVEGEDAGLSYASPPPLPAQRPMSAMPRPTTAVSPSRDVRPATASPGGGAGPEGAQRHSALIDYPGGQRTPNIGINITNSWPSATHHSWQQSLGGPAHMDTGLPPEGTMTSPDVAPQRPYSAAPGGGGWANRRTDASPGTPMAERQILLGGANRGKKQGGTAGFGAGAPTRPQTAGSALARTGAHVNAGVRGAPVIMHAIQKEVEMLKEKLLYQHSMAEASAEKIRMLEYDRDMTSGAFGDRAQDLQHMLSSQQEMIKNLTVERDHFKMRAEVAETKLGSLEIKAGNIEQELIEDCATMMRARRDHQERDHQEREVNDEARIGQLEYEVERLSEQLKMETTSINALKRQLLEFSDIAERHKSTLRDGISEPGLEGTIGLVRHLFHEQENPTGEMYAVQKVMVHYHSDMRAVFLFYSQLECNFTDHCYLLLSPTDCQNVFGKYGVSDSVALEEQTLAGNTRAAIHSSTLTYEAFLAAIIHVAARIKRPNVPFLSEAVREYTLRYISKAGRVTPAGLKKGQVRSALQGTARIGETMSAMGPFHDGASSSRGASPIPSPCVGGAPRKKSASSAKQSPRPASARPGSATSRPVSATTRPASSRPASGSSKRSDVTHLAQEFKDNMEMTREEAAQSTIVRELELMDVASQGRSPKEIVRRGGGYNMG
eukprot:gene29288-12531_t